MMQRGCLLALTGKASDAVETITSGVTAMQSTGTTMWMPLWLSYMTRANAEIGQFDNARRCSGEAMAAVEPIEFERSTNVKSKVRCRLLQDFARRNEYPRAIDLHLVMAIDLSP